MLISKLYRQMYANTGISTDSAPEESEPLGPLAGEALPTPVPRKTDAGSCDAGSGPAPSPFLVRVGSAEARNSAPIAVQRQSAESGLLNTRRQAISLPPRGTG